MGASDCGSIELKNISFFPTLHCIAVDEGLGLNFWSSTFQYTLHEKSSSMWIIYRHNVPCRNDSKMIFFKNALQTLAIKVDYHYMYSLTFRFDVLWGRWDALWVLRWQCCRVVRMIPARRTTPLAVIQCWVHSTGSHLFLVLTGQISQHPIYWGNLQSNRNAI